MTPDLLPDSELDALGLTDVPRARRILLSLAGQGVTDDIVMQLWPSLRDALQKSPDPDRAVNNFARWTDSVTSRYTHFQYLLGHPAALQIFFNVCGVSQLFSDILIRNPEYFEILANPGMRGQSGSRDEARAYYRELSAFVDNILRPELKLEAMRRFKQREILRIGTRDILGLADMPTTAREFSNLADACVQKCLEIGLAQIQERYTAEHPVAFTVIGMGKLGGQELNYSSDIDLMFVAEEREEGRGKREEETATPQHLNTLTPQHPNTSTPAANSSLFPLPSSLPRLSALEFAHKLAEFIIKALTDTTQNGHLFRVDMRLRPEGRFGALVRTLGSYQSYYESWAEPWERQALLKARAIAGDTRLGDAFAEMTRPFVYRRSVTSEFLEAIRRNKERIEQKAVMEGVAATNVKIGYGGIRDIEFTAQLLQLERGGRDPRLRTPNTLEALARLRQAGALSVREAGEMREDYCFLRTVEHRLQILYERQTQTMPTDPHERRLLARRLGFADTLAFDAEYTRRTERVHTHFERLFYGARGHSTESSRDIWRNLLENIETPQARTGLLYALQAEGFQEPEQAVTLLKSAAFGSNYGAADPEAQERLLHVLHTLIAACAHTGTPDAALRGVVTLAQESPNPAALYRTFEEGEEVLLRLSWLAAGSPPLMLSLIRHLQWLDLLVSDEIVDPAIKTAEQAREELAERLPASSGKEEAFWDALALYIQRERLRIGARDVWGEVSAQGAARELTVLAEAVIEALLERGKAITASRFSDEASRAALDSMAVIGMGKLGGRELGYASDWDILIVYEAEGKRERGKEGKRDEGERERGGEGEINTSTPDTRHPTPDGPSPFAAVNAVAEYLLAAGQNLRPRNAPVDMDARLRPEGRKGALIYTAAQYRQYYETAALTWEHQSLTRARPVAGNMQTGRAFLRMVHGVIYGTPLSGEKQAEIQAMKRRIETERLKSEERQTNIKLGHGGLSDIEFTTQMLQLRFGAQYPSVRLTGTIETLHALTEIGALAAPDAARLSETHTFWTALRNRLALCGSPSDTLPADPQRLRALAIGLGSTDAPEERAEEAFARQFRTRMQETRTLVEWLFYQTRY